MKFKLIATILLLLALLGVYLYVSNNSDNKPPSDNGSGISIQ